MSTHKVDFNEVKKRADVRVILSHFGLLDDLEERGEELVGYCPLGDKPHGKENNFTFNITKKTFQCSACKKRGSVLDFVKYLKGINLPEAAKVVDGIDGMPPVPEKKSMPEEGRVQAELTPVANLLPTKRVQDESNRAPLQKDGKNIEPISSLEESIMDLAASILERRLKKGKSFTQPGDAKTYLLFALGKYEQEVFGCLFLDTRHRLICFEEMFHGTVDGASIHPREVVKRALLVNAAAIICGHNHPSGNPDPSQADRAITERIKDALTLVDVRLLDHIVVAGLETVSMAERGLI